MQVCCTAGCGQDLLSDYMSCASLPLTGIAFSYALGPSARLWHQQLRPASTHTALSLAFVA